MKNKKVVVAGVSLSEACAISENHLLSEALIPLSELGKSGGESAKHMRAQRVISLLSDSLVFSRAKCAQLAQQKFTNSRLARKWR